MSAPSGRPAAERALVRAVEVRPAGPGPAGSVRVAAEFGLLTPSRRSRPARRLAADERAVLFHKVLANPAIEQVVEGPLAEAHLTVGKPYQFRRVDVPLRDLDDAGLERLSREGQLALNLAEMKA